MSDLKIGVDVDGIVADFNESFIRRVIEVTGEDRFPARPFDIPTWNYPQYYGYSEAQVSAVWDSIKADPTFWVKLEPYAWTRKFLARVNQFAQHAEVYFITSRLGVRVKAQTEDWLMMYTDGFSQPTVLISSMKGYCAAALKLTHYIDDRDLNVRDVRTENPKTRVYLLDHPWNRDEHTPGIARITDPNQMLAAIAG